MATMSRARAAAHPRPRHGRRQPGNIRPADVAQGRQLRPGLARATSSRLPCAAAAGPARDAAPPGRRAPRPSETSADELRELRTVNELIRTLTSTLELPEILHIVLDRLKRLTQAEALSFMLYDADRQELVFAATETLRENALVGVHLPPSTSLASWVARSGETVVANDVQHDPRFYPEIDRVAQFTTRNLLAVPLRRGDQWSA